MDKLSIRDIDLERKRVLVRVDYNVPMEGDDAHRVINDDTRIRATLPTLDHLIGQGARLILMAHLGRPGGRRVPALSLRPVAAALADLLARPVAFAEDCIGEQAEKTSGTLLPGDVLLLENLRFHAGEEADDPAFSRRLASLGEAWVNDAFGAAHRAHASTRGVAEAVAAGGGPRAAGLLMERELRHLGRELEDPRRPFVVILGGAKVSDKIAVIDRLLERADVLLVGGAMAYTFKLALGRGVGASLVERDFVEVARKAMDKARERGVRLLLPEDNTIARPVPARDGKGRMEFRDPRPNTAPDIPEGLEGVDIGAGTVRSFAAEIARAGTILWNGPMGIFEDERFAEGTFAMARSVAEATDAGAMSIIGGGDSVKAVNRAGLAGRIRFMSTGGGASLEFLEGRELPGVSAIEDRSR